MSFQRIKKKIGLSPKTGLIATDPNMQTFFQDSVQNVFSLMPMHRILSLLPTVKVAEKYPYISSVGQSEANFQ